MKKIIRQMVIQKFQNVSSDELISYGKEYGFHLTSTQAKQIIDYIRSRSLNPFKESDRFKLLKKIAKITDEQTAKEAHSLFKDMTKKYGVEDMF